MRRTNGFSLLVLVAFSTFLVVFIGALCVKHIAEYGLPCEAGGVSVAAAKPVPDPAQALELVRLAYAGDSVCPANRAVR